MKTVLTVPEAAATRGVTRTTVYRWISEGLLKARKFGRDYAIKREDLKHCQPQPQGRPWKKGRN